MKFTNVITGFCFLICLACHATSANQEALNYKFEDKTGTSMASANSGNEWASLLIQGESAELLYKKLAIHIAPVKEPNSEIYSVTGLNIACFLENGIKYSCGMEVRTTDGQLGPTSVVGANPKIGGGN